MNVATDKKEIETIELSLLKNSLCYLLNSVKNLESAEKTEQEDANEKLKYSILNLWSGIFLLLKLRLYREHWILLASDTDKATWKSFVKGEFQGVNFEKCKDRLTKIAGVDIDKNHEETLNNLRKQRNRIEHFFDNSNSAEATKSLLFKGLGFSIDFLTKQMECPKIDKTISNQISEIKEKCFDFKKFCEEIKKNIELKIKNMSFSLHCDSCDNECLVYSRNEDFLECLFCLNRVEPVDYSSLSECMKLYCDGIVPVEIFVCSCGEENTIIKLTKKSKEEKYHCLNCQINFDSIETCGNCGNLYPEGEKSCTSCDYVNNDFYHMMEGNDW